jgi:hypothetical protein
MMNKLRENISSVIALLWTVAAISIFTILIYQGDKSVKDTVQNIIILILGYYYGSTRAMNDKIRSDMQKPEKPQDNPQ